jgi:hypothetical protein
MSPTQNHDVLPILYWLKPKTEGTGSTCRRQDFDSQQKQLLREVCKVGEEQSRTRFGYPVKET